MSTFKIEKVEDLKPLSHADFLFRKVLLTLVRLTDGRIFQVRRSPSHCGSPGDVVELDERLIMETRV